MKTVALFAFAGAAFAQSSGTITSAAATITSLTPLEISLAIFSALPASLQTLAIENPSSAEAVISEEFVTGGTPSWFTALPTAVQSYIISEGEAGNVLSTSAANSTAGIFANSTIASSTPSSTTTSSTLTAASLSSVSASSTSSTGMAALPTQVIAGGFVGLVGVVGMLAL